MIQCAKCGNDTRTSSLVTAHGPVMVAGTIATDPEPVVAQVCTACGYIELYAPQPIHYQEAAHARQEQYRVEAPAVEAPIPTV
jgi:predicted nucleic-acid-binding Zn-ribbon protein